MMKLLASTLFAVLVTSAVASPVRHMEHRDVDGSLIEGLLSRSVSGIAWPGNGSPATQAAKPTTPKPTTPKTTTQLSQLYCPELESYGDDQASTQCMVPLCKTAGGGCKLDNDGSCIGRGLDVMHCHGCECPKAKSKPTENKPTQGVWGTLKSWVWHGSR